VNIHQPLGTLPGNYYGTRRPETVFAHTSPVYVLCDAGYYVRYLDLAIAWLDRNGNFARPSDKTATLEAFRAGQRVYRRRMEEAAQRKIG
jgi:hypothetical protein